MRVRVYRVKDTNRRNCFRRERMGLWFRGHFWGGPIHENGEPFL